MVLLIAGATHSGKTVLAQKVLEEYKYPYLSIDHLKMGLIRSGNTDLTPVSDEDSLTGYLWPIVREMIKTAVENEQNLVIEGCYIPFDWKKDFEEQYLREICYVCLILSERYIRTRFEDIRAHAGDIENRLNDTDCTVELLISDNNKNLQLCQEYGCRYILIEDTYSIGLKELAEQLETALRINSRMRGDTAIDTIDNREYLADTFAAMERTAEAVEQYEAEKTALKNLFGADCDRIQHVEQKICGLRR